MDIETLKTAKNDADTAEAAWGAYVDSLPAGPFGREPAPDAEYKRLAGVFQAARAAFLNMRNAYESEHGALPYGTFA